MFDSVRLRLTLWCVGLLGLILAAFSTGVYILGARSLHERLDAELRSSLETTVAALQHPDTAGEIGNESMSRVLQLLHFPNQAIAIFDAEGRLLVEKPTDNGVHVRLPTFNLQSVTSMRFYSLPERNSESDDSCRGVVQHIQQLPGDRPYLVVVNQSLETLQDQLDALQNIFYMVVPMALALAGVGGWFLARKSLAPVVAMSEQAQHISVGSLDQRLPIANPRDELGHLATTFNELLSRLSNSFAQQRQFMADASHELRTPLSAIRTASEVMLQREDREKSEYRDALTIIEQQARRLTHIVDDMFVLAAADAGHPALQNTEFYLDELLAETARAAAMLASQKNLKIHIPSLPEALFRGDEGLVRQMIWNLLDNAIKYTTNGGKAEIALRAQSTEYVITIIDTGIGIAPEIQPHIFERFYRAEKSRSRTKGTGEGGAGLGLPIARWIAEAHHGRLELRRSDETGSAFVIFLPRV
jgi:two-component system OmpR family sensor kinase